MQSCGADWRHDHYKCLSVTDSSLGAIILGDCDLLGKPGVTNQPWSFVLAVPCKRQCALCKRPAMSVRFHRQKTRLLVSQVVQCQDQCPTQLQSPGSQLYQCQGCLQCQDVHGQHCRRRRDCNDYIVRRPGVYHGNIVSCVLLFIFTFHAKS